jgi:predicted Zn-dependent protease
VISLVNVEIANAGPDISIEEWYYYAGRAYEAQGNIERAMINYEVAVARNGNFTEASERLQSLRNP